MALQIAQLGYMPNMGMPHVSQRQVIENPWAKIGQMVVANVAQQMASNAMSSDYAGQATREGAVSPDAGLKDRPWYARMVQGPAMDEKAYLAAQGRKQQSDILGKEQAFTHAEGEATRKQQRDIENSRILAENNRFDKKLGVDNRELDLRALANDRQTLLQGGELDVARQNAATRAAPPSDPDVMNKVIGSMAGEVYKTRMEQWARAAGMASAQGQQPPPQPTFEQSVMEAAQAAQKFIGGGMQQPVRAPGIPLVDPASLKGLFGQGQ